MTTAEAGRKSEKEMLTELTPGQRESVSGGWATGNTEAAQRWPGDWLTFRVHKRGGVLIPIDSIKWF